MSKTYHTSIPNSTFYAQPTGEDGKPVQGQTVTLQFKGDTLEVSDPAYIKALDSIADTPGCPIYTSNKKTATAGTEQAFAEVKSRAGEVVEQIAKAGQRA